MNASKYQTKVERKIYYCQYHYRHINELRKHNQEPFCNMKITFYPNKDEDEQFKTTGEHTHECLKLYNENRSDKKIYLESYENFKEKLFEEFNKKNYYNRKDFIELAYKILNDYKYNIKINENKIKNLISKWKNSSQKFTKYLFLNDTKTFDGYNLLQCHIYKILTY